MKKILLTLITLTLFMTACTNNNDNDGNTNGNGNVNGNENNNTLGDDDGDGVVEDGDDGGNNTGDTNSNGTESGSENGGINGNGSVSGSNVSSENNGNFENVDQVNSAEDAVNFIGANVYSLCRDSLPLYTETKLLSSNELESITYGSELADVSGIEDIIVSKSIATDDNYALIMLRTDGTGTDDIIDAMRTAASSMGSENGNTTNAGADSKTSSESRTGTDEMSDNNGSESVSDSANSTQTGNSNSSDNSGNSTNINDSINSMINNNVEKISSITLDDDVVIVMGSEKQVDNVINAVISAANNVYDSVGKSSEVL